jgi:creatinine amidohydrolase
MRLWLALVIATASCLPVSLIAQTNPLWTEQKVKNFLPHMTSAEVRDLLRRTDMVLIPIPALEQHGLQGPIGTDFYSGVEQAKLIAQRTDILVAPILFVGQSPYHLEYPGSISLSAETLQRVYFEAAQSLINQGFRRIILYASHTGNQFIASFVADRLNQETAAVAINLADGVGTMRDPPAARPSASTSTAPVPFDRHAGVVETSSALYLFPTLVQMDKAARATLTVPAALSALPPLVAAGDRAATLVFLAEALKPKITGKGTSTSEMSTTGVWSERDPHEATAEQGRQATEAFVDAAVRFIDRWKQLRPSSAVARTQP